MMDHMGIRDSPFDSKLHAIDDDKAASADAWIDRLKSVVHRVICENRKDDKRPVKIAILDSGVDGSHPEMRDALSNKTIVEYKGFPDYLDPRCDRLGHGTHGTSVLLRTAPIAAIYIARVANDDREIVDENEVAKAIKWAIEKRVHIISISWGMKTDIKSIADVIAIAIKEGILIFASASNNGANYPITFPARLQGVFCIGSADGLGAKSSFNPPSEGTEKYSALGEAVEAAYPASLSHEPGYNPSKGTVRTSGTSTSAPVAAAIAALLLDYIDQITDMTRAQRYENIRKLFIDMSKATTGKDYRYLAPWYLFEGREDPKSYIKHVLSVPAVIDKRWGSGETFLGFEPIDSLVSKAQLAVFYMNQGMFDKAAQLGEEVLEGSEKLRGKEHPETLTVMAHLAYVYWKQGKLDEAVKLGKKTLTKRTQLLGAANIDTLTVKGYLALIYQDQGKLRLALKLGEEVLEGLLMLPGDAHRDITVITMGNLGLLYMKLGMWAEAVKIGEEYLEMKIKLVGKDHPETQIARHYLATAYRELRKSTNASTSTRNCTIS